MYGKLPYTFARVIHYAADALRRALKATEAITSVAVVVEAKDDAAFSFYKQYGFIQLPDHAERLFIPMATVKQLFDASSLPPPSPAR